MGTMLTGILADKRARIGSKLRAGLFAAVLLLPNGACEWRQEKGREARNSAEPSSGAVSPLIATGKSEKPSRNMLSTRRSGEPAPNVANELPFTAEAKRLTDKARFLAGLSVEANGPFAALCLTEAWKRYAKTAEAQWARFKIGEAKMRAWAKKELEKAADPSLPVFYPFSGPDVTFADIFVPAAGEYVLVGLEGVGSVPREEAFAGGDLDAEFALYLKSFDDLLGLSFFRTNDLKEDLANRTIDGVVPIIMVLLARLDKEIMSIEFGGLNEDGEFETASPKPTAVTIRYRGANVTVPRTLRYFSANLYDGDFLKNKGFRKFVERELTPCFTFMKSASYLMRNSFFGAIRKTILNISNAILQDDSAIPYKFYNPAAWDVSLYGHYDAPIKLFKDDFEQELFEAYRTTPGIKPLGFRFGYSPVSCLLLAVKKK